MYDDGDEDETDDRGAVPGFGLGLGTAELGGIGGQQGDVDQTLRVDAFCSFANFGDFLPKFIRSLQTFQCYSIFRIFDFHIPLTFLLKNSFLHCIAFLEP